MPPGQPVHKCAGDECARYRPCKQAADGLWYCRECHPALSPSASDERQQRPPTAADGGREI